MKKKILPFFLALIVTSCDLLDTRIDTLETQATIKTNFSKIRELGFAGYTNMQNGFWRIDNNIAAPMSDEAEQTASTSKVQMFNEGSWNAFDNPDNGYAYFYQGLRNVNYFLEYSVDYKKQLVINRDTLKDNGYQYHRDVSDIGWMRAESHVLRAYYYFELTKRYGDVPFIDVSLAQGQTVQPIARKSYDELVEYMVSEIDSVKNSLQTDWKLYDSQEDGRFTKGAAMALKARILLYAASPLHNAAGDLQKWIRAAQAANEVIQLNKYALSDNYRNLFIGDNSVLDKEVIMSIRIGSTNEPEKANYPIGTPGGLSGVTPSENLVSAYENRGTSNTNDPYDKRDPRLGYTIVTNNSTWNGRTIEIWKGGKDDYTKLNSSKTGYYLKKFLNDNLYLMENQKVVHSWILFRYAEVLLNYAEAMNEAYGPDNDNGYGLSARQAVNKIRKRLQVSMPDVVAINKEDLRTRIKHERRIELAFEEHRYWDLIRWKDAEIVLNQPILGVVAQNTNGVISYSTVQVEIRKFDATKMYFYPIPQTEVNKTGNVVTQNPNW